MSYPFRLNDQVFEALTQEVCFVNKLCEMRRQTPSNEIFTFDSVPCQAEESPSLIGSQ